MPIDEVFPNPTAKQVIFAIQFPNLFFIENKIGDFQMKIMNKFPESSLVFQRQILLGVVDKIDDQQKLQQEQGIKIWQFTNPTLEYELNVSSNSLSIISASPKTYNNQQSENRFRDIIEYVLKPFLEITNLPIINRIGLRYIDECPFDENTNASFKAHFNTCFSIDRFSIEDSEEHNYIAVVKRGEYFLRYVERYNYKSNPKALILDFDGFATNVPSAAYLDVADQLHTIIVKEYESTIKEPVYTYMRSGTR